MKLIDGEKLIAELRRYGHETISVDGLEGLIDVMENVHESCKDADSISRKAAIDAIGKTSDELYENIKKGATFPQRQWFDGMAHAQNILENLSSIQPDKEKISNELYRIYLNTIPHKSAGGVVAIKYHIAEIWREIYGEDGPKWMT